jgi:hypothetical protein
MFQVPNKQTNTHCAHTHLRIISLVLVQPQACKVPSIQTSVSHLNTHIISCLQHMTCVMKNLTNEQSVTENNSAGPSGATRHPSAEVWSCTVPTAAVLKWSLSLWFLNCVSEENTASILKGEWLCEGGCEVMQWKKTCQFEGICPITATEGVHRNILPLSSVTELVLVDVKWRGGRNVRLSITSEDWGTLAVHTCHPITSAPAWPNSVNLQTQAMCYSEMLEQTWHTSWYENTKDYHHLNS